MQFQLCIPVVNYDVENLQFLLVRFIWNTGPFKLKEVAVENSSSKEDSCVPPNQLKAVALPLPIYEMNRTKDTLT